MLILNGGKKSNGPVAQNYFMNHEKIGQYNNYMYIKQTAASSDFLFLSRDRVSNIYYKMHMFLFSWDPSLGFMQYLEHLKFLEYILGVEHEWG